VRFSQSLRTARSEYTGEIYSWDWDLLVAFRIREVALVRK